MLDDIFIKFSAGKLEQLSSRIQDCLKKLTYDQVWTRHSESENSVGNLVIHLCGNLGQWIGSGVAGKPDTRKRHSEFEARGDIQPADLVQRIEASVSDAVSTIRSLTPERLTEYTN